MLKRKNSSNPVLIPSKIEGIVLRDFEKDC